MRPLVGERADTHPLPCVHIDKRNRGGESTPGRQRRDKIEDRELCEELLAENCVIKRGGRLEMEKESEDKKLRKGFREEGGKEKERDRERGGEFGTFLAPLKFNIRTARGRISGCEFHLST